MKDSQQNQTDFGLEEYNYILKAWKDLKDSIFNVLYVILDKEEDEDQQQSLFGLIFQSGFDYLQMLAFPFDDSIMAAWNGGETLSQVSSLFSKLNIMSYLPGVSFNTFLILLYGLIVLIILVLVDIIYVSYSFSKKRFRFTWPLVILAKLVPLFVTIFFLPITETLLSVVRCSNIEGQDYQAMISFPEVVCWKDWHLFHSVLTLLFTSLFVFISSIVALALFQPRMVSKKLTARQNSTGQVIFIMNKIICQLIFSFTPFKQKWVYSLMLFGLSGWLYWTYNMKDPFYKRKASKFFRIASSYYFWTNFMLLVSQLLGPLGFNGGLVIWISGLPFIGVIIGFENKSSIDQLFSFNLKFKSGQQLEGHLRYVLQLLQSQNEDKNSYMLISGYIEKHKQICVEDDCPLKMGKKINKELSEREDIYQKFLLQIERMYKMGIKKYPNCTRIRLSFAFFQLERLDNKNRAYEQFKEAVDTGPSFLQQFIIYRFKKIIKEKIESSEGQQNTSDLIEIIRFENHIALFEEALLSSARLHKDFWVEMKEEAPDLNKLNQIGTKITKIQNVIKENYEEIEKINSSVPEILYSYSFYLFMIAKNSLLSRKLLESAKKIYLEKLSIVQKMRTKQKEDQSINENMENAALSISCRSDSFGKILNMNSLFIQLTGYRRQEIIERSFQKILPQILKGSHSAKINQWVSKQDQQDSKYLNVFNQGYIKNKSGFIIPVQYKVVYQHSSNSFLVLIRNSNSFRNCCHLILDQNKKITDCSILCNVYFGLDKRFINDQQTSIESLFGWKNFEEVMQISMKSNEPFAYKLFHQNSEMQCEVSIQEVKMNVVEVLDHNQGFTMREDCYQSQKMLGYYLRVFVKDNKKQADQKSNDCSEQNLFQQSQDLLQLYEDPNVYDILLTQIADAKTKNIEETNKFKLTFKIKTMRLLNNEIKMVYDQKNNVDFDNNDQDDEDQDDAQLNKLNEQTYHEKIRSAINTKIEHKEVSKLYYISFFVIAIFVVVTALEMVYGHLLINNFGSRSQLLMQVSNYSNTFSLYLTSTLEKDINYRQYERKLLDQYVALPSLVNVSLVISPGVNANLTLKDSLVYLFSKIREYYRVNGSINIDNIYYNYAKAIYPAIQNMDFIEDKFSVKIANIMLAILFCISFALSTILLISWIYSRVTIDKKKNDILIWFLDIPIDYISYLSENCDSYLKKFLTVKEISNKGMKTEENFYEEYHQAQGKEQQLQEQQKSRKSLILKQRKMTLCSRLSITHCKMIWIIIFGMLYSIMLSYQIGILTDFFNFFNEQISFSSKSILWSNSIHISDYLIDSNRTKINDLDVADFRYLNSEKFENTLSDQKLNDFNTQIFLKSWNQHYQQIISAYNSVYYQDICQYLGQQSDQCLGIVDSSLKGGFRTYSIYLRNPQESKKKEIRLANQKYAIPAILSMINAWKQSIKAEVDKSINLTSILFYVIIFGILLIGIIVGLSYLNYLNNELNQSIKMLNMIPFKLLSKSRKQTRNFIAWIIKEANKKRHKE